MFDLILKILICALLYGGAMFAFGLWLGKTMNKVSEEPEDLLEWYEREL